MSKGLSFLRVASHPSGRLQEGSSTIKLITSHLSQVSVSIRSNFVDEIKWAVRLPKRYARPTTDLRYSYEETIQNQIKDFLAQGIGADYTQGRREINLDLTMDEAELLYTASDKVKEMASSGELQKLHENVSARLRARASGHN